MELIRPKWPERRGQGWLPCPLSPPRPRPCLHPAKVKIACQAKTSALEADHPTRAPRPAPGPSGIPLFVPRYWPKRHPLAHPSLLLTLADLDARANLGWLPPLGPHANMHERFAVTLTNLSSIESTSSTALFAFLQPPHNAHTHTSTNPHHHHHADIPFPSHPMSRGRRGCYATTTQHRGNLAMVAQILRMTEVPSVTRGHE